jgi:hypothetical protein
MGSTKTDEIDAPIKIPYEIDGAKSERDDEPKFRVWSVAKDRLNVMNMQAVGGATRMTPLVEKHFHGRKSSEALIFNNLFFRRTADGIYLLGDEGELKTSLPTSTHPLFFGEDGLSLLLGHEDGGRKCALKHMQSSMEKPSQWRETGFNFSCIKSRVVSSRTALTVTKIESGNVEIIVLGSNGFN